MPHAPEADFFKIPLNKLRYLCIGMAWQLHGFIANLAKSINLPNLTVLDFTDSLSVFEADLPKGAPVTPTKLSDSADLLKSMGYDKTMLNDMQKMIDTAYNEANAEQRFDDNFNSFADYCALFKSKALQNCAVLHLRNAFLSEAEFLQLKALRPDLQFSVSLEAPHVYVSHWQGKFTKPYQHLIIKKYDEKLLNPTNQNHTK